MSDTATDDRPVVVVTGANGFVGSRTCVALVDRGTTVRAIVRRAGAAPSGAGIEEVVGDFSDPALATAVVDGATAVVTTVHPMGADRATQRRVGVDGTVVLARAAAAAGVPRLVHVSTAAVYDNAPDVGDIDEDAELVGDERGAYATTKRDTDRALADVEGITRVLVRPPAILGPGPTSVWNSLQPARIRDNEDARRDVPERTFAWVHVDDLARLIADIALGRVAGSDDPERGPVPGACTVVNVAAFDATARDYVGTVADAFGVTPRWVDEPAWTGRLLAERARRWGWEPHVDLATALQELRDGITASRPSSAASSRDR